MAILGCWGKTTPSPKPIFSFLLQGKEGTFLLFSDDSFFVYFNFSCFSWMCLSHCMSISGCLSQLQRWNWGVRCPFHFPEQILHHSQYHFRYCMHHHHHHRSWAGLQDTKKHVMFSRKNETPWNVLTNTLPTTARHWSLKGVDALTDSAEVT